MLVRKKRQTAASTHALFQRKLPFHDHHDRCAGSLGGIDREKASNGLDVRRERRKVWWLNHRHSVGSATLPGCESRKPRPMHNLATRPAADVRSDDACAHSHSFPLCWGRELQLPAKAHDGADKKGRTGKVRKRYLDARYD